MGKEEQPLQLDMFSGERVDTRTHRQRKLGRQHEQPQQMMMFSQREIAQFGVNTRPLLPLSPNTKLLLISEDPRTEEEIERDRQRAAEEETYRMFEISPPSAEDDSQPNHPCFPESSSQTPA
jgi:hypothetical protein